MAGERTERVLRVLDPFTQIRREVTPYPDPKVPEYMFQLVRDEEAYRAFEADPSAALKQREIDTDRLDVGMFQELARAIRQRAVDLTLIDKVADTLTKQETNNNQDTNWDHSSSWLMNKDGYNVIYDQGHSSESDSKAYAGQDAKFETSGITLIGDELLRHEINLIFFPAQPLVTPELVEKVKAELQEP